MEKIRLLLLLLTLAITLGPAVGIVILYRNNLLGLVVPPDVTEIVSGSFNGGPLESPKLVSSQIDMPSGTATLTFNFTNPLKYDVTITSMSAEVECDAHNYPLGNAALTTSIRIPAG